VADSGVIRSPEEALKRIMAVETPIRTARLVGLTGMLPVLVVVVLAVLILIGATTTIPRMISRGGPPPSPYMPYNPQ
jgi:hypothetical protein